MKQEFLEYLRETSLSDNDKKHINTIFDYLEGNHPQVFANRIFLFEGEPGVGKTFLAKKLISSLNKPVLFLGQTPIFKNVTNTKNIKELLKILENFEEGIVYIDDLKYVLNFVEFGELNNEDRHRFMKLLESFKDNNKKTILIMTLNDSGFMDASWEDRIDVKIEFELPSNKNKLGFLLENFSDYVKPGELKYLSDNTVGYNYRDLPQILKLAYYHGDKIINMNSIRIALSSYTPSTLSIFNVKQGIELKLNNLFLKEDLNKELKRIILTIKNKRELEDNHAEHSNFLIFEGPSGVGKTYSALALAGEIGIPLIKISARDVYSKRFGMPSIFKNIARFQDAIVLFDDADKIIEGDAYSFNDGGIMISELNAHLDELEKAAVVILSVNDSKRLGRSLKDRFKTIKFENPGLDQRISYFDKRIKESTIKFNLSEEAFAKITEGMNYRNIDRFWNECIFYALENNLKVLTIEHLNTIIGWNLPNKSASMMIG